MRSAAFSIDGPKGRNQDRYLEPIGSHRGWIAAIADGVGGRPGGEIAASEAIAAVRETAGETPWHASKVFVAACQRIRAAELRQDKEQMATTMSLIRVVDGRAFVAHAGDTRIYHARGSGIVSRTEDQTEVATLLRDGVLTRAQARSYPRRNVITSYLSSSNKFDLFENEFSVEVDDVVLLLTDGAYDLLRKSQILDDFRVSASIEEAMQRFKTRLTLHGVRDDSTVVAVQV